MKLELRHARDNEYDLYADGESLVMGVNPSDCWGDIVQAVNSYQELVNALKFINEKADDLLVAKTRASMALVVIAKAEGK